MSSRYEIDRHKMVKRTKLVGRFRPHSAISLETDPMAPALAAGAELASNFAAHRLAHGSDHNGGVVVMRLFRE